MYSIQGQYDILENFDNSKKNNILTSSLSIKSEPKDRGVLNIINPKNDNNPLGFSTILNFKNQGLNFIRGKTTFDGDLLFNGDIKSKKNLNVKGNMNVNGSFKIDGTFEANEFKLSSDLDLPENLNVSKNLKVDGSLEANEFNIKGDLDLPKNLNVKNNLKVGGSFEADKFNIKGNLDLPKDLNVKGKINTNQLCHDKRCYFRLSKNQFLDKDDSPKDEHVMIDKGNFIIANNNGKFCIGNRRMKNGRSNVICIDRSDLIALRNRNKRMRENREKKRRER